MRLQSELIRSVAEGGLCPAGLRRSLRALPPGSGRCVRETWLWLTRPSEEWPGLANSWCKPPKKGRLIPRRLAGLPASDEQGCGSRLWAQVSDGQLGSVVWAGDGGRWLGNGSPYLLAEWVRPGRAFQPHRPRAGPAIPPVPWMGCLSKQPEAGGICSKTGNW